MKCRFDGNKKKAISAVVLLLLTTGDWELYCTSIRFPREGNKKDEGKGEDQA